MGDIMYGTRKLNIFKIIVVAVLVVLVIICAIVIIYEVKEKERRAKIEEQDERIIAMVEEIKKQDEIKKQEEEKRKEEERLASLPQLTEIGMQNIANIYKSEEKRVFLTFDDGPSNKITPQILEILEREGIKANFFLLGSRVELYPDLVKKEFVSGHFIANHGYSHKYSQIYASAQSVLDEYNKTTAAIQNAIGVPEYNPHLFRFPGGLVGGKYKEIKKQAKELLNANNITNIDWNALTGDAEGKKTVEDCMSYLKQTMKNKKSVVILMHDASDKQVTADLLPQLISYLRENEYRFATFYEVMH